MSRGLSQNQRRILGLALAFNRELHGTYRPNITATPAGEGHSAPYRGLLLSESARPWDLQTWMATHFVMGAPMDVRDRWYRQSRRPISSAKKRSLKASATRAVSGLWRRGMLAAHTWIPAGQGRQNYLVKSEGYCLTPAGLAAAAESGFSELLETVCENIQGEPYPCDARNALRAYAETLRDNPAQDDAEVSATVSVNLHGNGYPAGKCYLVSALDTVTHNEPSA